MKNYNQIDMYKTIIEKCSNMNGNLLEQKKVSDGKSSSEENTANIESMLQLISVIEIGTKIRQDDPIKIYDFLLHNKYLCKKYRNIGTETNDLGEIKKYERLIDEIVDPLIDLCCAIQMKSGIISTTTAEIEGIKPDDIKHQNIGLAVPKLLQQINCNATKEQIEYYFLILTKEINPATGKPYMTAQDVREFIALNFAACGQVGNQRYFNIGTEVKSTITYFMYQFYLKYDNGNIASKIKYVNLLISNFEIFANDNPQSLLSNMTPSKYPKNKNNVIDIEKYFPKNK